MALCFPRSSTAAFSATRPTTWLSASMMYHLRSTASALALKVFIGSRELSHAAQGVSKFFAEFLNNDLMTVLHEGKNRKNGGRVDRRLLTFRRGRTGAAWRRRVRGRA